MHFFQDVDFNDIEQEPHLFDGKHRALVTAGDESKVNTMTVSWGGLTYIWNKRCAIVYIRGTRYTKEFVDAQGRFSISFLNPDKYHMTMKYLGAVSGRNEDKISGARLNVNYDNGVPFIDEARTAIICKTLYRQEMAEDCAVDKDAVLPWYQKEGYHTMYIAEIEKILTR